MSAGSDAATTPRLGIARETIDAIRLALAAPVSDAKKVATISALVADSVPSDERGKASVRRFLRAAKRVSGAKS